MATKPSFEKIAIRVLASIGAVALAIIIMGLISWVVRL